MDDKKLEVLAEKLAKEIKSEKDLSALSRRLVKLTVETALNAEIVETLAIAVMDLHPKPLKEILATWR